MIHIIYISKLCGLLLTLNFLCTHPLLTKKKIAYGLAIGTKRIGSENEDYEKRKGDIAIRLINRGHLHKEAKFQLEQADILDRNRLYINIESQRILSPLKSQRKILH